ncbi:hypothetical protein Fmac_000290 [Flemingia macrophylla]|uniref:HXXXD-type acyl-transferase family protein n=1 Tax=Flemingia macrophylla TaxID=520843 RepID=A0ABD1NDV7_9FABA
MSVSDIVTSTDVPPIVQSLFDHHKVSNYDGHTMPLCSLKVTKLLDGFFIGISMNHAVVDGIAFFNFCTAWFEIIHAQLQAKSPLHDFPISHPPIHNRWFPDSCDSFVNIPLKYMDDFKTKPETTEFREKIFHFSGEFIAKLKANANRESKNTEISSLQSLAAHVWRSITRARNLPYDQKTRCKLAIDNRSRLEPPLPQEYFGNAFGFVIAESKAGELLEHDLGWAARKVHLAVSNYNDKEVRHVANELLKHPLQYQFGSYYDSYDVVLTHSPKFNPYGKDLWLWEGVQVLTGRNNKHDGKVRPSPSSDGRGNIDLEVSLSPNAMKALESDEEIYASKGQHQAQAQAAATQTDKMF